VGDELCRLSLGPADLQVRILDREMAQRVLASRLSMGHAMLVGEFPSIAAVFYHRAVELEAANFARRAEFLGAMMAHEIGHLLLAENSHSEQGILLARWRDQDLKLIAQGRLWFTSAEVARIGDNSSRRQCLRDGKVFDRDRSGKRHC
jgi:hypothetical protein